MPTKTYEVKLLIEVDDRVYWPTYIKRVVAEDESDPFKDEQSHLAALLKDCVNNTVLGLEYCGATTTIVPNGTQP